MDSVDNILFFPTCVINKVEIEEDMFLVYVKNFTNAFSLKKTKDNFRKITVQFQKQYDQNLDHAMVRIFQDAFSTNISNKKMLSLRYVLIGLKHYKTLQQAVFSDIHETDLVSTEIIYKDKQLCQSLNKRYRELKKIR